MKIEGASEEIAALIVALQERQISIEKISGEIASELNRSFGYSHPQATSTDIREEP